MRKNNNLLLAIIIFTLVSLPIQAKDKNIVLKEEHPTNYVIKSGDTLWEIAARFLRDPWRWPDIWHVNPQISNPHLIYPGDEVELIFKDGKPQLVLRRAGTIKGKLRTVKLSPSIRRQKLSKPIPTIPLDAIQQFLSRPNVMTQADFDNAPYILGIQDNHLISGAGNVIYSRGLIPGSSTIYSIVRPGKEYTDFVDGEERHLGIEAIYVGEATVNTFGKPSSLTITQSSRESLIGDRLIVADPQMSAMNFTPQAPKIDIQGKIIHVVDGVSRIGQYQIVVINRGAEHSVEKGHVLVVLQKGDTVTDRFSEDNDRVQLPNEQAGYLLLFRVFNKVSYALVMKATRAIRISDIVSSP